MQASALPARLQRFSRSERALHWVIAATVIPMILSGLALGINIWHHQVFVIHIGSLFALVAAVLLVVAFGNRPELGRLWRQLRRFDDSDVAWLEAAPRSLVGGPVPPAGRFNAGQKLNGTLMPLLLAVSTVTGLYLWAGQVHHLVTRIDPLGGLHNVAAVGDHRPGQRPSVHGCPEPGHPPRHAWDHRPATSTGSGPCTTIPSG